MVNEVLLPIDDDGEDIIEDAPADELPEEEIEEEAPDELAALRAEVERLKGLEGVATDLRRSVGRIQSLEQRVQQDAGNSEQLTEEISKQFGGVHELLSTVVENIDETALDPTTKARVRQAFEDSRRAAETASLRKEATEAALEAIRRDNPQLVPANTQDDGGTSPEMLAQAQRINGIAEDMFSEQGIDPDDPQYVKVWEEVGTMIRSGRSDRELVSHFRQALTDSSPEDAAATRRQTAKDRAGKGSPTPAGAPDEGNLYSGDLDKDVARLRELGVNI